jgi:16S rRNA (guanine527-N7)-methyltransferase
MKLTDPSEIAKATRATVAALLAQITHSLGDSEAGPSEASVALEAGAGAESTPTDEPLVTLKAGRVVESLPGFKTGSADGAPLASEASRFDPPTSDHRPWNRSGTPRMPPRTALPNETDAGLRLRDSFLDRVETFAAALALWGAKLNLTSAPDDPAEIAFHILDSLAPLIFANRISDGFAFAAGSKVLDLGSGAGFPALILAAACEADFVLLEARRKRASFLSVTAAEMGLSNAQINSSRTDALRLHPEFDVVTARAFAEPAIVFATARAALKPGGRVILYASPAQRAAIDLAVTGSFEPAVFLEYEVMRGAARVAHVLAIARRLA